MGRENKREVTPTSRAIIDVCRDLLGQSGTPAMEFFEKSGISSNYWYKRMRYVAPFNTTDIDKIADTLGTTSLSIYKKAAERSK